MSKILQYLFNYIYYLYICTFNTIQNTQYKPVIGVLLVNFFILMIIDKVIIKFSVPVIQRRIF